MNEMTEVETCPNCEVSLQGLPIPQESIDAGHYGDKTHYSRTIGVEIPSVYDGVLYWRCPDCGWAWNRWSSVADMGARLFVTAESYVVENNEDVSKGVK